MCNVLGEVSANSDVSVSGLLSIMDLRLFKIAKCKVQTRRTLWNENETLNHNFHGLCATDDSDVDKWIQWEGGQTHYCMEVGGRVRLEDFPCHHPHVRKVRHVWWVPWICGDIWSLFLLNIQFWGAFVTFWNDAGAPASTVGWRHPGYIHTAFLKELGPGAK